MSVFEGLQFLIFIMLALLLVITVSIMAIIVRRLRDTEETLARLVRPSESFEVRPGSLWLIPDAGDDTAWPQDTPAETAASTLETAPRSDRSP